MSSTLVSSSAIGRRPPPAVRSSASPIQRRTTFGQPSGSRVPAPRPTRSRRSEGRANSAAAPRIAIAVGVTSSEAGSFGCASSSVAPVRAAISSTAGAGTGRRPCAARAVPPPAGSPLAQMRSTPSVSRAANVPTTSTIASTPPTSWRCASSPSGTPCTARSASPSSSKVATARSRNAFGQRRRLDHRDDSARRPRRLRRLDAHVRLRRREARAAHGRGVERPALDRQGAQRLAHGLEVRAGVEGGAEQHVARRPEARIDVGDPHRCPPAIRRRRPAARTTPAR